MRNDNESIVQTRIGSLVIWEGWLFGPVAWAAHQNMSYGLTYWACEAGTRWPIFLVTLLALGVAITAGYVSWRLRQSAAPAGAGDDRTMAATRARFVTTVGVLICAISGTGILVETIPVLMLDACARAT
ncbi:hypothetical protein [Chelativorans salis]|uniref:Uncharacterized protein n=1 Tax=Chelativorans salis TaxID=2978478 RepID=A0ABT2LNZ5_9HYPH|nr:hypothetical protein [Chelativorans sp. EGI FJ00035]MCT7376282.1 hypothetical protein [Chelativorans sp. EGI FJ00035]